MDESKNSRFRQGSTQGSKIQNPKSKIGVVKLGTRGSKLALCQTEIIVQLLKNAWPDLQVEIKAIKTTGDKRQDETLSTLSSETGGKGVFVKEIEHALLSGEIDIAIHSMKDLPTDLPSGLVVGSIPQREDATDALVSKNNLKLDQLPTGGKVGTGSIRRRSQLLHLRKDLQVLGLRGNLDTRIKKFYGSDLDAIVLASAGLKRLGFESIITDRLSPQLMVPDPGQGAIGLEIREDDLKVADIVSRVDDKDLRAAVCAERELLRRLGGGCHTPIGAFGYVESGKLQIMGMVASVDGERRIFCQMYGGVDKPEELGANLAEALKDMGADELLKAG